MCPLAASYTSRLSHTGMHAAPMNLGSVHRGLQPLGTGRPRRGSVGTSGRTGRVPFAANKRGDSQTYGVLRDRAFCFRQNGSVVVSHTLHGSVTRSCRGMQLRPVPGARTNVKMQSASTSVASPEPSRTSFQETLAKIAVFVLPAMMNTLIGALDSTRWPPRNP
eukprot:8604081-Pyramimonas_sp.AAC.3